jgi:hypothetical protein
MNAGGFPVRSTIFYQHPQRPDEAGMTVVAGRANAAAMKDQLETRGFLIIKIETAPSAGPADDADDVVR